jgi:tRNA U34 5-methylaminomethyl-2-thiouridine-forming methyltransferase MnmC
LITVKIIETTDDGSHTIAIPEMHVTYHSKHGAINESMHIFVNEGLRFCINANKQLSHQQINIFEVGFGTGLNALLSLNEAIRFNQKINYETIELYPLLIEEVNHLNYTSLINENLKQSFISMHEYEWNKVIEMHPLFSFKKSIKTYSNLKQAKHFM